MKANRIILWMAGLILSALTVAGQGHETISLAGLNLPVPDGNASGLSIRTNITSSVGAITGLKVKLQVAGNFNGDLYAYLRHVNDQSTNFCVLLNRVGRTDTNPAGYDDAGLDVTFESAPTNNDIHLYRQFIIPAPGTPLTGTWQPDGRNVDPFSVNEASARTTSLTNFYGKDATGQWTLYLADLESGGTNLLVAWELEITGPTKPMLVWSNPADIVYGTALGAAQLNATANVPGSFVYNPPATTVLNAGQGQTLSVLFIPTDLVNYVAVTGQVSINVLKKDLSITVNNAGKVYGAPLPAFSATFTGFVNGDTTNHLTTQPVLTTPATAASPVGSYPITASGASASNYTITYVDGTLTISPATTIGSLSSSSPLAQLGQSVTFTFQVDVVAPGAGTPTGMVQFRTNNVAAGPPIPLSGGVATFVTSDLPGGTNTITAEYAGDGNFLGTTNQLLGGQIVNRPPTAGNDTIGRTMTNGAKVQISTLLGNDNDADGDTLILSSISTTSTNGGTITTNGGWVFYQPPSLSTTNQDAFSYTLSDGRGGQATGWVLVNTLLDTAPSPNLTISSPIPGTYIIYFDGIPGLTYRIQTTTNLSLLNWITLGTATADPVGRFQFTNTPPPGETNRFYRSAFP